MNTRPARASARPARRLGSRAAAARAPPASRARGRRRRARRRLVLRRNRARPSRAVAKRSALSGKSTAAARRRSPSRSKQLGHVDEHDAPASATVSTRDSATSRVLRRRRTRCGRRRVAGRQRSRRGTAAGRRVTSWPRRSSASGSAASTSASPPVFAHGATSDATISTRSAARGRQVGRAGRHGLRQSRGRPHQSVSAERSDESELYPECCERLRVARARRRRCPARGRRPS